MSTNKLWPPATNNMTIEEMVELKTAAEGLLDHLKEEIPDRCSKKGHKWDNPKGKETTEEYEYRYYDDNVNYSFCSPGTLTTGIRTVFVRNCTICGTKESDTPKRIECSPF